MRLSDIKGERVFDVIADIAEPLCNIAMDKEASSFFKRIADKDGSVEDKIKTALPALLKGHKNDLITVMATIEGVDIEEYKANITMAGLFKSLYEMLTDEDLLAFL